MSLFFDLAESLLAAQCQISMHERTLYTHNVLELVDDTNSAHLIERRGRAIERVAVSLQDYGAIHDQTILSQVLDTMVRHSLSSTTARPIAQVERIRKRAEALAEQQKELLALRPEPMGVPFMNCCFLSLGHLMMILDGVTSNESFQKSLLTTRYAKMGTLDLYYEHSQMLELRAHARSSS